MSLKKSTTRRVALFTSSSLIAASLTALAFTAAVMAPSAAMAANECAPVGVAPSANGATADTYACTGATTYETTGITYSSEGNLTVNTTGAMSVGPVGINLTGNATDNVTFMATGAITGTSGAVIDIQTASGNISATLSGSGTILGTTPGVTHGLLAQSTGGGDIIINKSSTAVVNTDVAGADAAIAAITNGGDITMTFNAAAIVANTARARLRGLVAQTSGSGAVNLTLNGAGGISTNAVDGVAVVDVIAGTGGATINFNTGSARAGAGHAVRVASTGGATVNNTNGLISGSVDFAGVTAGGVTFTNSGSGTSNTTAGRWLAAGDSAFSDQADLVSLGGTKGHVFAEGSTIDFGGGVDTFDMTGTLAVEGSTVTGLEAFNNSGPIYLGGTFGGTNATQAFLTGSDLQAGDVFSMPGTTFTGTGASQLILDVVLGGVAQVGCETPTGTADCLDLRGGATAGSTILTINDVSSDALLPAYVPQGITIIDVAGGSTSADHFTFDLVGTNGYVHPVYGPAFDRPGNFVYLFRFDEENQRFVLVSQPKGRDLFDYAMLSGAAQSIWHMTAETVTDRQADLRGRSEATGLWLRTSGEVTRRDTAVTFAGWDDTYTFDNDYKLYAGTIMGGMDLISGTSGGLDYVLGAQIGYVTSSFDLDVGQSSGRFTGATGGVYGSIWSPRAFLDATFNLNGLTLDHESPALGAKTNTYTTGFGARMEGGMRWRLGSTMFAEPLVSLAFVRTSFEEISLFGGEVQPADAQSRRAALGLRVGGDVDGQIANLSYFVTGRAWNEFDGESAGVINNPGVDLPFADELTGGFGEAEAGLSLSNDANTLSGFLTSGVKWKDGYNAVNLSLGLRMAW